MIRTAYWDNWKGIAIIAVVVIHASGQASRFPDQSFNWFFGLGIRQIVNFAVPMFFALAGFFAASSIKNGALVFFQKRLARIILPYCIWTGVYLAITTPTNFPTITEILRGLFFGTGIGIGYYVIVLLQFTALTPFIAKIRTQKQHFLVIFLLTFLGVAFSYYTRSQTENFFSSFPGSALLFLVWYPFYHLGFLFGAKEFNLIAFTPSIPIIWTAFFGAIAFAFVEGIFWANQGLSGIGASQIKVSSFLASICLFLLCVKKFATQSRLHKSGILTYLGKNSYTIYLVHILFLRASEKAVNLFDFIYETQPIYILLTSLFTIAGCSIFIFVSKRILGSRLSGMVLG